MATRTDENGVTTRSQPVGGTQTGDQPAQRVTAVPNQGYANSNQGYANSNQGYANPNQGYANPNQGYANPNQGYANPNRGYANPNQGYANANQGYAAYDPNQSYAVGPNAGYAPAAAVPVDAADRTRWGPIWAGFVTTISTFLIVEAFLLWLGALGVTSNASGGLAMNRPWVTWIIAVCAFFLGGLVTAMTSPVRGAFANFLNGLMVWGVATTLIAVVSIFGGGAVFGTVGAMVNHVLSLTGSHHVTPGGVSDLKTASGWAFWTLLSTAIAAGLGGMLAGFGMPVGSIQNDVSGYATN